MLVPRTQDVFLKMQTYLNLMVVLGLVEWVFPPLYFLIFCNFPVREMRESKIPLLR